MKKYFLISMAMLLAVGFVSCSKDDDEKDPDPTPTPSVTKYTNLDIDYYCFMDLYSLNYGSLEFTLTGPDGKTIETKTISKSTDGTKITKADLLNKWFPLEEAYLNQRAAIIVNDSLCPGCHDNMKEYKLSYSIAKPDTGSYSIKCTYNMLDGVTLPSADLKVNYPIGFRYDVFALDTDNEKHTYNGKSNYIFYKQAQADKFITTGMPKIANIIKLSFKL